MDKVQSDNYTNINHSVQLRPPVTLRFSSPRNDKTNLVISR